MGKCDISELEVPFFLLFATNYDDLKWTHYFLHNNWKNQGLIGLWTVQSYKKFALKFVDMQSCSGESYDIKCLHLY